MGRTSFGEKSEAVRGDEKPHTGVGRHGTAPPLTSHGGRSRVAEREGGKTVRDGVTKGCHAVLTRFIGATAAKSVIPPPPPPPHPARRLPFIFERDGYTRASLNGISRRHFAKHVSFYLFLGSLLK